MNRNDWEMKRESRIKNGTIDFIRKKISAEYYEKIRYQTYEEYIEEDRQQRLQFVV